MCRLRPSNSVDPISLEPIHSKSGFLHVLPNGLVHKYDRSTLLHYLMSTCTESAPVAPLSRIKFSVVELRRLSKTLPEDLTDLRGMKSYQREIEILLDVLEYVMQNPSQSKDCFDLISCTLFPMLWYNIMKLNRFQSALADRYLEGVVSRLICIFHADESSAPGHSPSNPAGNEHEDNQDQHNPPGF